MTVDATGGSRRVRRAGRGWRESLPASLATGAIDELGNAVERLVGEAAAIAANQCFDDLFGRSLEERVDEMLHSRSADLMRRRSRQIHVAELLLFVPQVALLLQHP